jgi:hypothetical protein
MESGNGTVGRVELLMRYVKTDIRRILIWAFALSCGCNTVVVDHQPLAGAGNLLDADTASMEGGLGHWAPWYSVTLSRAGDAGEQGAACMQIAISNNLFGVSIDDFPGFAASAGPHYASFWARAPIATDIGVSLNVNWMDANQQSLQQDSLTSPTLTPAWQETAQNLQAPAGTVTVWPTFVGNGQAGEVLEIDNVFLGAQ